MEARGRGGRGRGRGRPKGSAAKSPCTEEQVVLPWGQGWQGHHIKWVKTMSKGIAEWGHPETNPARIEHFAHNPWVHQVSWREQDVVVPNHQWKPVLPTSWEEVMDVYP